MKPSDVLGTTMIGGSPIGIAFIALGSLMLSAANNAAGNSTSIDLFGGSVLFAAGAAFVLVSAILVPALRAIQSENAQRRLDALQPTK